MVFYMFVGVSLLIRGLQAILSMSNLSPLYAAMVLVAATLFSVASPLLIGMFSGRLFVYEEAVAYLLFYQWALLGMVLLFAASGRWRWYVVVCLCAGFAAYIRPSGVFPAVISLVCVMYCAYRQHTKPVSLIVCIASLFLYFALHAYGA